ncbi:MAG: ferritin-like domain-containing protein [Nocardioidaceae bacterium]
MGAVEALQDCLAAEHASLYGYGLLGGVVSGVSPGSSWQVLAISAYGEHRRRRDQLTELITRLQAEPVSARPVYKSPRDIVTLNDCRALGQRIEGRCADFYGLAVSETVDDTREFAARALTRCCLREVDWGADIEAFPAIKEF